MLYLIYGTDTYKSRKKLHELLQLANKKRPDAELFKITTENWSESQFDELLVSRGLFEQKYTVVLDNLFEKKPARPDGRSGGDIKDYVLERLQGLADSEQIFLMLEGKVDAPTLKKIETKAKQVQEFEKKETEKKELNIFSITNDFIRRDKKNLWISYIDLLGKGAVAEEIHGIFFWQVKNMILATRTKNQTETGLSPFVYKNALTGTKKFTAEELKEMSSQLVDMTHKVREGDGELPIMLEKWILSCV